MHRYLHANFAPPNQGVQRVQALLGRKPENNHSCREKHREENDEENETLDACQPQNLGRHRQSIIVRQH